MPKSDGYKNLRPQSEKTPEERQRIAQMGGKASGKRRREKRTLKDLLELAMGELIENKNTGEQKSRKEITCLVLADKCVRGDLKAIALAQSILGEEPSKKVEVTGKDGRDLIPARTLSREEAAAMLAGMDEEY